MCFWNLSVYVVACNLFFCKYQYTYVTFDLNGLWATVTLYSPCTLSCHYARPVLIVLLKNTASQPIPISFEKQTKFFFLLIV